MSLIELLSECKKREVFFFHSLIDESLHCKMRTSLVAWRAVALHGTEFGAELEKKNHDSKTKVL